MEWGVKRSKYWLRNINMVPQVSFKGVYWEPPEKTTTPKTVSLTSSLPPKRKTLTQVSEVSRWRVVIADWWLSFHFSRASRCISLQSFIVKPVIVHWSPSTLTLVVQWRTIEVVKFARSLSFVKVSTYGELVSVTSCNQRGRTDMLHCKRWGQRKNIERKREPIWANHE